MRQARLRHIPGRVSSPDVNDGDNDGDDLSDAGDNYDGGDGVVPDDGLINFPDPHLGGDVGPALDLDPVEPAQGSYISEPSLPFSLQLEPSRKTGLRSGFLKT